MTHSPFEPIDSEHDDLTSGAYDGSWRLDDAGLDEDEDADDEDADDEDELWP